MVKFADKAKMVEKYEEEIRLQKDIDILGGWLNILILTQLIEVASKNIAPEQSHIISICAIRPQNYKSEQWEIASLLRKDFLTSIQESNVRFISAAVPEDTFITQPIQ